MGNVTIQSANSALVLLMLFVAFSMILGGRSGGRWAYKLILAPFRLIWRHIENRIAAMVTILVLTVLTGYGFLRLVDRVLNELPLPAHVSTKAGGK